MMTAFRNKSTPYQATAICTPEQARRLSAFHQHRAMLGDNEGILLAEFPPDGPCIVAIVFHGLHAQPSVSDEIQNLLNSLKFQIRNNPR